MRELIATPAWLRRALRRLRAQKHEGLIRDLGDEAHAHRYLMSPANRAGIGTN